MVNSETEHKFRFNSTEFDADFDLNWYNMPLRHQDPTTGRWNGIDPVTHFSSSTYASHNNNPVFWSDPSGADWTVFKDFVQGLVGRSRDGLITQGYRGSFGSFAKSIVGTAAKNWVSNKLSGVLGNALLNGGVSNPRLNFNALENNPSFKPLTTNSLRELGELDSPDIEVWKRNISLGNAFEEAYGTFSGNQKGGNILTKTGDNPINIFAAKIVRPDFRHSTTIKDRNGNIILRPMGGVVEVKASQNPIDITTNSSQIDAEINVAKDAGALFFIDGGSRNAGSFTLVLTHGTEVKQRVVDTATRRGVNLYVQYAFQNKANGKIVFSNPIPLNNVSKKLPSVNTGSIDGVLLNIKKAMKKWRK